MATPDQPTGFRPVQTRNGAPWCGKTQEVAFVDTDANAAFIGSLVRYTGESIENGTIPVVTLADPGDTAAQLAQLAGAVVRFDYDADSLDLKHRLASTERRAHIPADRDVMYFCQEDGDTTPLTGGAVGANINFTSEVGDATVGNSTQEIDSDTVNTTATLPLRIVRASRVDSNELGAGNNTKWLIALNTDHYNNLTGV